MPFMSHGTRRYGMIIRYNDRGKSGCVLYVIILSSPGFSEVFLAVNKAIDGNHGT